MAEANDTKERILDAAFQVFTENGYEKASVRAILEKSQAAAGSFYHFFPSKDALFEAVIGRYLAAYARRVEALARRPDLSPAQRQDALLGLVEEGTKAYFEGLQGNKLHWTVQYALHERTMGLLFPSIRQMVEDGLAQGRIKPKLDADGATLAAVLLRGVEGMLHARPMDSLTPEERGALGDRVRAYVGLILDLEDGR